MARSRIKLALLLALSAVVGFAGCGGSSTEPQLSSVAGTWLYHSYDENVGDFFLILEIVEPDSGGIVGTGRSAYACSESFLRFPLLRAEYDPPNITLSFEPYGPGNLTTFVGTVSGDGNQIMGSPIFGNDPAVLIRNPFSPRSAAPSCQAFAFSSEAAGVGMDR